MPRMPRRCLPRRRRLEPTAVRSSGIHTSQLALLSSTNVMRCANLEAACRRPCRALSINFVCPPYLLPSLSPELLRHMKEPRMRPGKILLETSHICMQVHKGLRLSPLFCLNDQAVSSCTNARLPILLAFTCFIVELAGTGTKLFHLVQGVVISLMFISGTCLVVPDTARAM